MKWWPLFLPVMSMAAELDLGRLEQRWLSASSFVERHPGYKDNQPLKQPAGTWQILFGVELADRIPGDSRRHCVAAKIPNPGNADGALRVVAVAADQTCQGMWDAAVVGEMGGLRSLQFSLQDRAVRLWWTQGKESHSWGMRLPEVLGVFPLSPVPDRESVPAVSSAVGELGDVYPARPCRWDDGSCKRCRWGVYRAVGDEGDQYFCGVDRCGEAHMPACPRGKRWQKSRGPFGCRGDNSHVFCGKGLKVECSAGLALCR